MKSAVFFQILFSIMLVCTGSLPTLQAQALQVVIVIEQPVGCKGGLDGQLKATVPGAAGAAFTYLWSNGATTQTISNLGAGTYSVVVADVTGNSGTGTIVLTEPSQLVASIAVGGILTCTNTSVQLSAQATGGTWPYSFNWPLTNDLDSITSATVAGSHTVILTDANGCQAQANASVLEDTVFPIVEGLDSSMLLCAGKPVTVQKVCTNISTVSYQWVNPQVQVIPGSNSSSIAVLSPGNYQVEVTNFTNGCLTLDSVNVINHILSAGPTTVVPIYLDSIEMEISGGVPTYTYTWLNALGIIVSNDLTLSEVPNGNYVFTVVDAEGCSTTEGPFTFKTTTAVSENLPADLRIFPNPALDRLKLQFPESANTTVTVFNSTGQQITTFSTSSLIQDLDVSSWTPGQYYFQIIQNAGTWMIPVIKL